jgi:DNA-binding response OmpR family regulator
VAMGFACGPRRILVVDDDVDCAEVLQEFLGMTGYEVSVAQDERGALAQAVAFRPDVILLDIHLRSTRGQDVCRRLSSLEGLQPRIIAVTGDSRIDEIELRALGVETVLLKPLDIPRLLELLRQPLPPIEKETNALRAD